jgi:recombination protein RecT
MSTQVTTTARQFFESESIQQHMQKALGDKSKSFATSVLGIINSTTALQKCDPASIYQCALVATTLDLPLNQNLGLAYIIPYGNKAQFQIGYKGFIQLAQRSGKFLSINAVQVFENDTDDDVRKRLTSFLPQKANGNLIGYCAYFKLLNGYEQILSMSIEDLQKHGKKFSKSFSGLWTNDFESMARKTVLKLLIQRFAPMSIEMQHAEIADQSVVKNAETLDVDYIDNTPITSAENSAEVENNRIMDFISEATSVEQLQEVESFITTEEQRNAFVDKTILLQNGVQ